MEYLKSYEDYVLGLYRSILTDIELDFPSLRVEFDRDYKRLSSAVDHHGLQFLLVTMNEYGKHFDQCLAYGRLTPSHLAYFGIVGKRVRIPKLFRGLLLRVFDNSGVLDIDPDVKAIRALRQLFYTAKKMKLECPDSSTWKQVDEFFKIEYELKEPSLDWDDPEFDSSSAKHLDLRDACLHESHRSLVIERYKSGDSIATDGQESVFEHLQRTFDIVSCFIGTYCPFTWRFRHGPGAVSRPGIGGYKYTPSAWPEKLERVFPYADFGFSNFGCWADVALHDPQLLARDVEEPSRLIAVPKTHSAPRLIAAEPTANQWCQQSMMDFFVHRVKDTFLGKAIKFDDQTQNGLLALKASHSEELATIDLKSASDRISCYLMERFWRFNPTVLSALQACRTGWLEQDIDRNSPRLHRLRKFSTMGSACTFPVQSILFSAIAVSSLLREDCKLPTVENIRKAYGMVSVFGDDIIIPTRALGRLQDDLASLGLEVNYRKTFGTGKFRESCGVDAYGGHDVTPVYILARPAVSGPGSILSVVDSANNFFMSGYYTASLYLKKTVSSLRRYVFPEVMPGSGALGWYTHEFEINNDHIRDRWNPHLQRREYLYSRPFGRGGRTPPSSNAGLLEYFGLRPTRFLSKKDERLGPNSRQRSLMLRRSWDIIG